jgi:hypothetical protein
MLPNVPLEKKIDFVLKMVATLVKHGGKGMSEDEKRDFIFRVTAKVKE